MVQSQVPALTQRLKMETLSKVEDRENIYLESWNTTDKIITFYNFLQQVKDKDLYFLAGNSHSAQYHAGTFAF